MQKYILRVKSTFRTSKPTIVFGSHLSSYMRWTYFDQLLNAVSFKGTAIWSRFEVAVIADTLNVFNSQSTLDISFFGQEAPLIGETDCLFIDYKRRGEWQIFCGHRGYTFFNIIWNDSQKIKKKKLNSLLRHGDGPFPAGTWCLEVSNCLNDVRWEICGGYSKRTTFDGKIA